MPIIQSAKKRVRTIKKASVRNAKTKRAMRESIKAFNNAVEAKKDTTKLQNEAFSAIDTAAKKGVISSAKASRKKQQINAASKAAGTTKVGTKATKKAAAKPAKKPAAKKPAVKKTATKKPAAKKAPAKKPAAKKK